MFVVESKWDDIPHNIQHEVKRALLNYFSVGFAGANDPTIDILVKTLAPFAANGQANLIGRPERTDILNAAALNAMSANVFDFDDTHEQTVIHPTGPVAAALLAYAQQHPVNGKEFMHALLLGIDIECRLGCAISPEHYARGWHITSTCGVVGAALACGRLMKLTPQQLNWALGSAINQACGMVETLGTMAKSTSVGNAARNGLLSALLASNNFSGPAHPIEGPRGFLNVMANKADITRLTQDLGHHWEITGNSYKPYPCGVVLNPVIEACLELAKQPGTVELIRSQLSAITLTGHPLLQQRTDRPQVNSGRASQVSAQHAVAVSLLRGQAGLAEFSDQAVNQPEVRRVGEKVRFKVDETYDIDAATVTLEFKTHANISLHVEHARGSVKYPLTDADIEKKFEKLSSNHLSSRQMREFTNMIWNLEKTSDVSVLMHLAQSTPHSSKNHDL